MKKSQSEKLGENISVPSIPSQYTTWEEWHNNKIQPKNFSWITLAKITLKVNKKVKQTKYSKYV